MKLCLIYRDEFPARRSGGNREKMRKIEMNFNQQIENIFEKLYR